jgi:hypothetical protein
MATNAERVIQVRTTEPKHDALITLYKAIPLAPNLAIHASFRGCNTLHSKFQETNNGTVSRPSTSVVASGCVTVFLININVAVGISGAILV